MHTLRRVVGFVISGIGLIALVITIGVLTHSLSRLPWYILGIHEGLVYVDPVVALPAATVLIATGFLIAGLSPVRHR